MMTATEPRYTPAVLRADQIFIPDRLATTLPDDTASYMSDDTLVMRERGPILGKRYLISLGALEEIAVREGWTLRLTQLESGVYAYAVL